MLEFNSFPQLLQNFLVGIGEPHSGQNFAVEEISALHEGHFLDEFVVVGCCVG